MKRTLLTLVLALALALSLLPLTAGAEWQQIPTVPADCRVVLSEGLELAEVRAFYQGDPDAQGEENLDMMHLEYTVTGPAQIRDVCYAATLETKPSQAEAAQAASDGIAGQEISPQTLPIRDSHIGLFDANKRGKTMYWVLAGLNEDSALAGWAVVEFTVGEAEDVGEVSWGGWQEGDLAVYWTCTEDKQGKSARLFLQGDISEEAPALAAVYNEQGQMLSAHFFTREGSASITGGKTARVFWLFGDTLAPRTGQMDIPLSWGTK